jgi:hypothetical protein
MVAEKRHMQVMRSAEPRVFVNRGKPAYAYDIATFASVGVAAAEICMPADGRAATLPIE